MIDCASCSICKKRKMGDFPSIIGFGDKESQVLVILDDKLKFYRDSLIDALLLELDSAAFNELFSDQEKASHMSFLPYVDIIGKLVDTFGKAFFTTSAKCYFEDELTQTSEEIDFCSIFTRDLIQERKIVVTTLVGLSQFSTSLIKKAELFETYKTSDSIIVVVPPFEDLLNDEDDRKKVKDIVQRARASIGA